VDFPTGYLTNCQDVGKIKVLALVSTGLKPGLVTVNLESWHLTCSAPPTANGEALRQKADARSVSREAISTESVPVLAIPILSAALRSHSRCGTLARYRPSSLLRVLARSVHPQLQTAEQAAKFSFLFSRFRAFAPAAGRVAGVVLRVFRQMMVGARTRRSLRPPVFLFS